jgi:hypothetical protein
MTTPYVTTALIDTIRAAGFHVGWVQAITERFEHRYIINAIGARTGESFTVSEPDEHDALVELAGQGRAGVAGGLSARVASTFLAEHWQASCQ